MGFFDIGRKIERVKEYSLEDIPVFSSLSPAEQRLIEKKGRLVQYRRGDIVYEEDTPSTAFYVVISGRFRLFTRSRGEREETTLLYFYRGDHFGEASLLSDRPHSATVEAKSDGMILKLDKEDFLKLVQEIPSLSLHLSRSLGHRLTKSEGDEYRREVKIAAFYAHTAVEAMFPFWLEFASNVVRETKRKVLVVDFVAKKPPLWDKEFEGASFCSYDLAEFENPRDADLEGKLSQHTSGFYYLHALTEGLAEEDDRRIRSLLTFLTYRFDYLMLRLPRGLSHVSLTSLKQSDVVYVYCEADPTQLAECSKTLQAFIQNYGFSKIEIKILMPSAEVREEHIHEQNERLLGQRIFMLLPPRDSERYSDVLRFLAREWAGTLVGLALGSGAAYGLAHIGVLKVLERENIPVDVVSGSSIGALVAGLWAAGYSADQLEALARSINKKTAFFKLLGFRDFSAIHKGFFKGNQITHFLKRYLGNKTFQDLRIPTKIVAANMFTSEPVIFEAGRVLDAIRASISIPGIFRPMWHKGDYLMDGGIIDPLPVRVLTQMGVKKVIAVNVLLGPQDRIERDRMLMQLRHQKRKDVSETNLWGRTWALLGERLRERYAINIFNVIMNTVQFMEYEIADAWAEKADVLIHPVVYEGHWAQFYEPQKFIKAGEEKTLEQLSEIRRLLVE